MINNMDDQSSGLREMVALEIEHGVRVFAGASGRISVGKTSTVINLAIALVKTGKCALILTAMREIHSLAKLTTSDQDWLIKSFSELPQVADIVLIDTAIDAASRVVPLSFAPQQVLIVLSGSDKSIADAYALIKLISKEYVRRDFLMLVNKVESEKIGRDISENIAKVTRKHLAVRLEFVGCILFDEKLYRSSRLCQPVVGAFP